MAGTEKRPEGKTSRGKSGKSDKKRWIQRAVKRPGALTAAAERSGRSVLEQARVESHSPDKRIAARGRLALRFKGKAKRGNIRKPHMRRTKRAGRAGRTGRTGRTGRRS